MNPRLDKKFPSVSLIERTALRRMPRFLADYFRCGMGNGEGVRRNRSELEQVQMVPMYSNDASAPSTAMTLLDQPYSAPFGVAPVGLGGLAWPGAPQALASAAAAHEIAFVSATFSFASLERLRLLGGQYTWFQLYRPNQAKIEMDLLKRTADAGYTTLVVTVDVPAKSRRDHDIHNGFSLPPRLSLRNIMDLLATPAWTTAIASETLRNGFPNFENFVRYLPPGTNRQQGAAYQSAIILGHITSEVFANLRQAWPHRLIAKGILDPEDAKRYQNLGADALVVSNHGGRQLAAAPSAARMLPAIRNSVGPDFPLIADGGVRTGLDICRMLALGADFVLLGRAFYYALAAMGPVGADHIMHLLKDELTCTMAQLGCARIEDLPSRILTQS